MKRLPLKSKTMYTGRALTPHQRIMRASDRGTGLHLNEQEVYLLSRDNAIQTCAENDDAEAKDNKNS